MAKIEITSPVGRIVGGSLYKANTTDGDGNALVVKHGPNQGQPRVSYWFHVAIQKEAGHTHWAQTAWGSVIWNHGNKEMGATAQSPRFAWKIEDGDSQVPNLKGRKNSDNPDLRGCWIIKLSGGFAPKVYEVQNGGLVQNLNEDFCKTGYFAEVRFSVEGNGSDQQPGVYLNHSMVLFRAFGPEITFGTTAQEAFSVAPATALPPGASMVPPPSAVAMPAAAPVAPAPAAYAPPPVAPNAAPVGATMPPGVNPAMAAVALAPGSHIAPPPAAPAAVVPNMAFVQMQPPVAQAPVPVPPPVPQAVHAGHAHHMTAAAGGASYEQMIGAGWDDATLVAHGMMLP